MTPNRPIIYLDVDGVLNKFPVDSATAANGAAEFMKWALDFGEVRWLTYWCPSGIMPLQAIVWLSNTMGISPNKLSTIYNPRYHMGHKPDAIDWEAHENGRAWFWLDDTEDEEWMQSLEFKNAKDHFILTRSGQDDDALMKAKQIIIDKCQLSNTTDISNT